MQSHLCEIYIPEVSPWSKVLNLKVSFQTELHAVELKITYTTLSLILTHKER